MCFYKFVIYFLLISFDDDDDDDDDEEQEEFEKTDATFEIEAERQCFSKFSSSLPEGGRINSFYFSGV